MDFAPPLRPQGRRRLGTLWRLLFTKRYDCPLPISRSAHCRLCTTTCCPASLLQNLFGESIPPDSSSFGQHRKSSHNHVLWTFRIPVYVLWVPKRRTNISVAHRWLIVASTSEDKHEQHLSTSFHRFSEYGVLLNPAKCVFGAREVTFLFYTDSAGDTRPLEEKVAAIERFQQPVFIRDFRHFLGTFNFYRRFVPQATRLQAPLHAALAGPKIKGSQPVDWTSTMAQAFENCKAVLSNPTLLAHPDPSATLAVFT